MRGTSLSHRVEDPTLYKYKKIHSHPKSEAASSVSLACFPCPPGRRDPVHGFGSDLLNATDHSGNASQVVCASRDAVSELVLLYDLEILVGIPVHTNTQCFGF